MFYLIYLLIIRTNASVCRRTRRYLGKRGQIETLLARFLWYCGDAGVIEGEAATAILTTLETCLPVSERTISHPLPDPTELVRILENRWA